MKYEIELTRKCNFKCNGCDRLCNIIEDNDSDLTLDEIKRIIDEINLRDKKIEYISVIGGEPTLNPQCYEICKYIKEHLRRCSYFALATNHSNKEINSRLVSIGFHIRHDDKSENAKEVIKNKFNKHFNIMISPKEKGSKIVKPSKCWVFNKCSISVHKYRGNIKWCWCGAGTSLCKLLQKEDFMKNSLDKLLKSDVNKYFEEVCPNCAYISYQKFYAKDTLGEVSNCFKDGLKKILEDNKKAKQNDS